MDNTSDISKPISELTQNALNLKADLVNGQVPASQLPSYVDDILEYPNLLSFPSEGESGKLYVDLEYNLTYRWSGSIYVEVGKSIALGETDSTAYRGDRGKTAYDHSQATGNAHGTTASQIPNTPAGTIAATNVQAAINELDGDVAQVRANLNDNLEPALAEVLNNLHGRILAFEQLIRTMIFRSLQIDNLDVVKNLTIHGSTNLFLTGVTAPVNLPDFAGQYYIDTAGRVGYLALSESVWLKIADAVEVAANSADMVNIKNNQEPAMAEIISHLNARILALESIIKNGLFRNTQIDTADIVKSLNLYGGTNLILIRTVAPAEVPDFIGQTYINTAAGVAYEAVGTTSVSHWKQKTN